MNAPAQLRTERELLQQIVADFDADIPWTYTLNATFIAEARALLAGERNPQISTGGEFEPWTEEAKARLNVALGFDPGHPIAWISADGALFETLESAKQSRPHSHIYPLGPFLALPQQEWIAVTERLPEEDVTVQVANGIALLRNGRWYTLTGEQWPGREIQWKVTHWQPLALPPAGEKS